MTSYNTMDKLLSDLTPLVEKYLLVINQESSAVQAAQFANALALHDTKMYLHKSVFTLLETAKPLPKDDAQKEKLSRIILEIKEGATVNKSALEFGFTAIERLVGRVLGVMKNAVQKEAPNYTRGGALYKNPHKSLNFQTDQSV